MVSMEMIGFGYYGNDYGLWFYEMMLFCLQQLLVSLKIEKKRHIWNNLSWQKNISKVLNKYSHLLYRYKPVFLKFKISPKLDIHIHRILTFSLKNNFRTEFKLQTTIFIKYEENKTNENSLCSGISIQHPLILQYE